MPAIQIAAVVVIYLVTFFTPQVLENALDSTWVFATKMEECFVLGVCLLAQGGGVRGSQLADGWSSHFSLFLSPKIKFLLRQSCFLDRNLVAYITGHQGIK